MSLTESDNLEADIIAKWNLFAAGDIEKHCEIGKAWTIRHEHPRPAPIIPTTTPHIQRNARPKPPPTRGDITKATGMLRNVGINWRFERTIYENAQHQVAAGLLQRIVHLFACVDSYGTVTRVSHGTNDYWIVLIYQ